MHGNSTSTTAMITTTIAAIVIGCGWLLCECDMDVSLKEVYQAYKKCQQGKARSINAQAYSARLVDHIFDTHLALHSQTYQPKPYTCFIANNGSKPREIFAADFSDRVVHHYLVPKLEAIISDKFIHHSCANQVGKGTHFGVNALQKMMKKARLYGGCNIATTDNQPFSPLIKNLIKTEKKPCFIDTAYFLQLDIHNFFYSIDKKILLKILASHLKIAIKKHQIHPKQAIDYYQLCVQILQKPKQVNYLDQGQLLNIPPHKQFKNIANNKGLPIGNLSSQFFANVYMNQLDQFVKHQLKVKSYVRFVDDFVLLGNKAQLQIWQHQIEVFLQAKLALKFKPEFFLKPINNGIDFLGYIIYPHYKLVRRRVINNFYQKLKNWYQQNTKQLTQGVLFILNKDNSTQIKSLFASYLGHFKHAKHDKVLLEKIKQFPWLKHFFYQSDGKYLSKTYHKFATKFSHQQQFFNHHFQNFIIILQKGRAFITNISQTQTQTHIKQLSNYLKQLQTNAQNYVFVSEQGYVHHRLKQRKINQLFISNH